MCAAFLQRYDVFFVRVDRTLFLSVFQHSSELQFWVWNQCPSNTLARIKSMFESITAGELEDGTSASVKQGCHRSNEICSKNIKYFAKCRWRPSVEWPYCCLSTRVHAPLNFDGDVNEHTCARRPVALFLPLSLEAQPSMH